MMENHGTITEKRRKSFDRLIISIVVSITIVILTPHVPILDKVIAVFAVYFANILLWMAFGAKNFIWRRLFCLVFGSILICGVVTGIGFPIWLAVAIPSIIVILWIRWWILSPPAKTQIP